MIGVVRELLRRLRFSWVGDWRVTFILYLFVGYSFKVDRFLYRVGNSYLRKDYFF